MKTIKQYHVAVGNTAANLAKEVNVAIGRGFQPFGSPFVNPGNETTTNSVYLSSHGFV